jgi:formylglycine-generating enzyme required for sulfatase activity
MKIFNLLIILGIIFSSANVQAAEHSTAKRGAQAAPIKTAAQIEDEYWEVVKNGNDLASLQQYLTDYPQGRYASIAKLKIAQLKAGVGVARVEGEPEMVAIPGRNYELGKFEVTQAQWRAVMGNNPSEFKACGDNCPVEMVSWNDIQEFLQKLNAKTGKNYRLPTEAEWEYACYGGTKTEYCGSNDINAVAWFWDNSGRTTHPVGQKQANGYGLYDMSGNVREWNQDWYDSSQNMRVLRGGSWDFIAQFARAAYRYDITPALRNSYHGFRLARTLP